MTTDAFRDQIKEQLKTGRPADGAPQRPSLVARAGRLEVANALREFSVLIAAEYPLHRALRLLSSNTTNKHLAATIEQVAVGVESGAPLWQTMARHPWYFDGVTVSIVRASEAGGKLGEGLSYLADLWEEDQEIRDKVGQALSYPIVLFCLFLGVLTLLLTVVVPTFARTMPELGGKVEGAARYVYDASDFVRTPYGLPLILIILALPVIGFLRWKRQNELAFDRMLGRIPVLGKLLMLADLTRFINMMHLLVQSGVGLLQGLDLAKGALGNAYLSAAVRDMHVSVEQGKSMVAPLLPYKAIPNRVKDMLAVGEESGKLEQMLHHLARSMRAELLRLIDRIFVLLQPISLVVMGVVVLLTFLTFFMPYFDILMNISVASHR